MPLAKGDRLGVYEILAPIGAGGMGEVYRAVDTKLGRDVALKILPPEMAANEERLARFHREARAAAALNHPNIVTLFSVEETRGVHFLTMELVDGQPLNQLIPAGGFAADRVMELAIALADAISAAHEKGLMHRDLKPANIMITSDGRVKVLDFGLAKEVRLVDRDDETVTSFGETQAGVMLGTPPYMSPEQISGTAVDHRTDIFSLGVILYEMLTGRRPFQGKSQMELAASILRDAPPEVTKTDVPAGLVEMIERCLTKGVSERTQSARLLASGLREVKSGSTSVPSPAAKLPSPAAKRGEEAFRVAVLPFKSRGSDDSLAALAEGLTEEISAGLSRFSYLRVIALGSSHTAARYIMEGNIRQAGPRVRATVQLRDTTTGTQLWAETYERAFSPEAIFEIQDDLVPRIVSTCADPYGVLPRSISDAVRGTDPARWSPYEALLQFFGYHQRLTAADHLDARRGLERAVEIAPRNADCWAVLSAVYAHEYGHGFNPLANSLERALTAARRAVDLAPGNHLAHQALSTVLLFRKEIKACLHEADRAIELNPLDGGSNAAMGANIAFAGDWDRGCALIQRSMDLNPHHPVWYRGMLSFNEYRKTNYRAAVDEAVKAGAPDLFWLQIVLAAAHGQLGEQEAAANAVRALNAQVPNFAEKGKDILGTWLLPDIVEHIIDGLVKAGLRISGDKAAKTVRSGAPDSQAGPSIAVLPFANLSADKDQEYFSDGLADEIINLLAQVSGLKVIARTSSFAFRGKEEDIRKIATALDVTHVIEGSVRRAGSRVRITAQLIAAADGSHIWSERYDREMSDVFVVQDEIAAAITRSLRIKLLPGAARQRYMPKLPAYEAYLKARYYEAKVTPEANELARGFYESSSALDPDFALAHLGIGSYWITLTTFGACLAREAVPHARAAIQRALEINPALPEAHGLLGYIAAFYDLDWEAAEHHFEFPGAKQAGFALTRPIYGAVQFLRGNYERAVEIAERSVREDPLEVWPRMNLQAYLQAAGREAEAREQLEKVLELDEHQVVARVALAMIQADQGELREALVSARRAYADGAWLPDTIAVLAAFLKRTGEESESLALIQALGSGDKLGDARSQALLHLLCGDIDNGADWVEKAIEQRDLSMMFYLRFVVCKKLRVSHRWPRIARMVNLERG